MVTRRTALSALLGTLLWNAGAAGVLPAGRTTVPDPWPAAPVLTRLFRLPASRADTQTLISTLDLTVAQVWELRRLAGSETLSVSAPNSAKSRAKIAATNAEKDRKVRLLLGADYARFREWVRAWWREQLRRP